MTRPDLPALLETAREAVSAAARGLGAGTAGQVTAKGDRDVVTDLDIAIGRRTRDFLRERTPAIGFLGEEEGGDTGPGLRWILDPVDGTANFIRGLPMTGSPSPSPTANGRCSASSACRCSAAPTGPPTGSAPGATGRPSGPRRPAACPRR